MGTLTGIAFGTVEALSDTKNLTGNSKLVQKKVIKYTTIFSGFYGAFQALRKTLHLYVPQLTPEMNMVAATGVCLTPLLLHRKLRPTAKYASVLVVIDAINGIDDL